MPIRWNIIRAAKRRSRRMSHVHIINGEIDILINKIMIRILPSNGSAYVPLCCFRNVNLCDIVCAGDGVRSSRLRMAMVAAGRTRVAERDSHGRYLSLWIIKTGKNFRHYVHVESEPRARPSPIINWPELHSERSKRQPGQKMQNFH